MKKRSSETGRLWTAYALIIIGSALIFFSGVLTIIGLPTGFTFVDGHLMIQQLAGISIYHGIIEVISSIVIFLTVAYLFLRKPTITDSFLVIVLVFSLTSLIGGGGFFFGFMLALIGSLYALISLGVSSRRRGLIKYYPTKAGLKPGAVKSKQSLEMLPLLNPKEKELFSIIRDNGGMIFQAELVEKSGFPKAKVSRILDKLEAHGLVERQRRGMTNAVVIK